MKLWKGRFSKAATSSADEFNASIEFDQRLYKEDITGSIAHAKMLAKQGIIPQEDADLIVKTLKEILADIEGYLGKVEFTIRIRRYPYEYRKHPHRIGSAIGAGKNSILAKAIRLYRRRHRLYLKKKSQLSTMLSVSWKTLEKLAKEHTDTVMPGYTHLQRAQPVTLAYHLLAYYQMFSQNMERFADCLKTRRQAPSGGSGALAGTTYDTDRDFLAKSLALQARFFPMEWMP